MGGAISCYGQYHIIRDSRVEIGGKKKEKVCGRGGGEVVGNTLYIITEVHEYSHSIGIVCNFAQLYKLLVSCVCAYRKSLNKVVKCYLTYHKLPTFIMRDL